MGIHDLIVDDRGVVVGIHDPLVDYRGVEVCLHDPADGALLDDGSPPPPHHLHDSNGNNIYFQSQFELYFFICFTPKISLIEESKSNPLCLYYMSCSKENPETKNQFSKFS